MVSLTATAALTAAAAAGAKVNASLTSHKSGRTAKPAAHKDKPTDSKSLQKAEKGSRTLTSYIHSYLRNN